MTPNDLYCAELPLRNYLLTHYVPSRSLRSFAIPLPCCFITDYIRPSFFLCCGPDGLELTADRISLSV